jgi:hypothetical protein
MLASTKTALVATGLWLAANFAKQWLAPDIDPNDVEGITAMSGPRYAILTVSQLVANASIAVAVVAFITAGVTKAKVLLRK